MVLRSEKLGDVDVAVKSGVRRPRNNICEIFKRVWAPIGIDIGNRKKSVVLVVIVIEFSSLPILIQRQSSPN